MACSSLRHPSRRLLAGALLLTLVACHDAAPPSSGGRSGQGAVVEPARGDGSRPGTLTRPDERTSVKFAVIGDSGRGTPEQFGVAAQMARYHEAFPFAFVIMLGDNIYEGPASPEDYRR